MKILEQFTISKYETNGCNEDIICVTENFASIIDGATSISGKLYDNHKTGYIAAHLVKKAILKLPKEADFIKAVETINSEMQCFYEQNHIDIRKDERLSASAIIYSDYRREIWIIGDCQCRIGGQDIDNKKEVDKLIAEMRSFYLQAELARGKSLEDLINHDSSEVFIKELIMKQYYFQNNVNVDSIYSYSVLDGAKLLNNQNKVISLNEKYDYIILGSDGYPYLKETLKESEEELSNLLSIDPLLIYKYKSVKGIKPGLVSFDDRAYLKIQI